MDEYLPMKIRQPVNGSNSKLTWSITLRTRVVRLRMRNEHYFQATIIKLERSAVHMGLRKILN